MNNCESSDEYNTGLVCTGGCTQWSKYATTFVALSASKTHINQNKHGTFTLKSLTQIIYLVSGQIMIKAVL